MADWLDSAGLAYLHLADTNAWAGAPDLDRMLPLVRKRYRGPLIINNGGITPEHAKEIVGRGCADAVAFRAACSLQTLILLKLESGTAGITTSRATSAFMAVRTLATRTTPFLKMAAPQKRTHDGRIRRIRCCDPRSGG